jgi:hypothetical protein
MGWEAMGNERFKLEMPSGYRNERIIALTDSPFREVARNLARELYDRFVMGGWEPQDAWPMIEAECERVTEATRELTTCKPWARKADVSRPTDAEVAALVLTSLKRSK